MYAARAAAAARDSATLMLLAEDTSPNVLEAAITGLKTAVGHAADPLYRHALGASDYQLVLTAASALAGTPDAAAASIALLVALDRISGERALTSRDPRIAILVRLRETGSPALAARLMPYLGDFDPAVADSAAALLSSWTGQRWQPQPRPPAIDPVTLQEVQALRGKRLVFSMSGGGQFEVELLVDEAPATVARIARLVRQRYYDGLTFHRVAPNFVIQGGSPGANEYSGIASFMRDELGAATHARRTLGVSTRGRDTGDGQIFVNLRDNPRLDYEYTVWGRIVRGLGVVDAVHEGDRIRGVEIRSR
jgi:cyclophilin family peptidyl-prolyl cis-trans isomerase